MENIVVGGGAALQFIFTGTSLSLEIDSNGIGGISAMIDDYTKDWTHKSPIEQSALSQIVNIATDLKDTTHTAFIRIWPVNFKHHRNGKEYFKIKKIIIDDNSTISLWSGKRKLAYFGDSWASAGNDYLRFINLPDIEVHSISSPGFTIANGLLMFPFVVGKKLKTDKKFDVVVFGYGVNDSHNRKMNDFLYAICMNIFISLIKIQNKNIKIFLLQFPRNISDVFDNSRYGKILENIASKRNCIYVSSKEIENSISWLEDKVHLDINGKHVFGEFIGSQLKKYLN